MTADIAATEAVAPPIDLLGEKPRILIIGCGLLGTSLGLALQPHADIYLEDISPTNVALARDLGAGKIWEKNLSPEAIELVVVCVPPDVTAATVARTLATYPNAVVTDVASVKAQIATQLAELTDGTYQRYVGSHPMAGKERSGPEAGDADLFIGRPWVITADQKVQPEAVAKVRALALRVGAFVTEMSATEHDGAVAAVSHVPQLMASLTAGELQDLAPEALALAGQGLRDTTRIAASDPRLWRSIILFNAPAIAQKLAAIETRLATVRRSLEDAAESDPYTPGAAAAVAQVIAAGNTGVAMIPGKHGGSPQHYAEIKVLVPDEPGQLAQVLHDLGSLGVNLEDMGLEHSHGAAMGIVRMLVTPSAYKHACAGLSDLGWHVLAE